MEISRREIDIMGIMESLITRVDSRSMMPDTRSIHAEMGIWNLELLTVSYIFSSAYMTREAHILTLDDILTFPHILTSRIW